MPAKHLIIHGRVQGVWYRGWAVDAARSLNLDGWVRNRVDGTVEALVSGEGHAVARFIALAHEGPTAARVTRIDASEAAEPDMAGFSQQPTV